MSRSSIGKSNRRLMQLRKAIRRNSLTPDGLLPIEGPHLLEEARRSDVEIVELFIRDGEVFDVPTVRTHTLSRAVFRSIRATREPQGVVALVRPPRFDLETVFSAETALIIVLAGIQDPGNAGTILRLGEAFGATGCLATPGTVSFYNDKLIRAAAGSLFRLPLARIDHPHGVWERMKFQGIRIVGTAAVGASVVQDVDWLRPSAVLFGNEGGGLSSEERALCDIIVRIPHSGPVDSLNAGSAAAILLYEAAQARDRSNSGRSARG